MAWAELKVPSEEWRLTCTSPPVGLEPKLMLLRVVQMIQKRHFCLKGSQTQMASAGMRPPPGHKESCKRYSKEREV